MIVTYFPFLELPLGVVDLLGRLEVVEALQEYPLVEEVELHQEEVVL
jgi:hypothetical protein